MEETLDKLIIDSKQELEELNKVLIETATGIIKAGNYTAHNLDFYVLSIINRTIALNKAFVLLLESENSLTAVSIVRLQLDNAIRLHATKVVENGEDFLNHFLESKPINTYKVQGQKLTDNFLVTELNKDVPGSLDLYNFLCDYVHFSHKHFDATKEKPVNEQALLRVAVGNFEVLNDSQKVTFYQNMASISTTIIKVGSEWITVKNSVIK
jgi:hypothetical protein